MSEKTNQVSMESIKTLRERTKLGLTECKDALSEVGGDIEKAVEWLKKKGLLDMLAGKEKKAYEGLIFSYIHTNGRIGVLLEVNCETDFVARTEEFKKFCKDVAMQIAGNSPPAEYIRTEDINPEYSLVQYELFMDKTKEEKGFKAGTLWAEIPDKQKTMMEKITEGRLTKWKKDISLMDQKFIKDPTKDVKTLLSEIRAQTKENIVIKRFTRYELGVN